MAQSTENKCPFIHPEGFKPDVIVVGSGLAGLSASVEAVRAGHRVLILEKEKSPGGNSKKASSGINGCLTKAQSEYGVHDSIEDFTDDTLRSGGGYSDPRLVDVLITKSASAIDFLSSFNIDLTQLSQCGGHTHMRTHRNKEDGALVSVGTRLIRGLMNFLSSPDVAPLVTIVTDCNVTGLIMTGDRVSGVKADLNHTQTGRRVVEFHAHAVVLSTGGFCADHRPEGYMVKHAPALAHLPSTNGPFATGDGLAMGTSVGAALLHMDKVQLHPTGFVDPADPKNPTKMLAPEALRACGGVMLNHEGKRFVNELNTRDKVVAAMMQHSMMPNTDPDTKPQALSYLLLNNQALHNFDMTFANFYISRGIVTKHKDLEAACQHFGIPYETAQQSLTKYGMEHPDPFGRTVIPTVYSPQEEVYVAQITPVLHYTMGGLRIDSEGQVLRSDGRAIDGLFAAGEVTGGVHGGNRLAGNSLLECVVYGRIAGTQAARWADLIVKGTEACDSSAEAQADACGADSETGSLAYGCPFVSRG